jgi:hypothetical protein
MSLFKSKSLIAMICRTEMEKTPKIVFPHEVAVLQALHGDSKIEITEYASPLGEQELDSEAEYARLMTEYTTAGDKPHPVTMVYPNHDAFLEAVEKDAKASKANKIK